MARKVIYPANDIFRDNIKRLITDRYKTVYQFRKKHPTISGSTIETALSTGGGQIATIGQFAGAFELQAYQLFIRNLNTKKPQQVISERQARAIQELKSGGDDEADGKGEKGGRDVT